MVIGFGSESTPVGVVKYWLVQNSWGENWGINGYAKIVRGKNLCGISSNWIIPSEVYDPRLENYRPYQLHLHDPESTEASCLDGSKAGVYFSPGIASKKTVVYFEGGGWCSGRDNNSVLVSCYDRSSSDLGSSNQWPKQGDYDYVFQADPAKDKFYASWNKFVIKYCDGGRHQSYMENPINVNGKNLYFRGHSNVVAALNFVAKLVPLELTTDFVLQGCSAGALATFAWADYFMDFVHNTNPKINYYALPDSAFYVDYKSLKTGDFDYQMQMKALYSTVNNVSTPFPQAGCVAKYGNESYKCFVTEHMFPYIRSPLFIIQSGYDTFQIPNILQSTCTNLAKCSAVNLQQIHIYHTYQQGRIRELMKLKPESAVWSPSCPFHCNFYRGNDKTARLFQVPLNSDNTLQAALMKFTNGLKDKDGWVWLDNVNWPENTPCAFFNIPDDLTGEGATCE